MFDHSYIVPLAAHAENEYAQVLEETGLLGLGALAVFGIMIFRQFFRCVRNKSGDVCSAAYGLGFGIIAILVHSMTDFGQHIPANSVLTATFCAILLVLAAKQSEAVTHSKATVPYRSRRLPYALTMIAICSVWSWAVRDANQYRTAEGYWSNAKAVAGQLARSDWQGTEHQYAQLIRYARQAAQTKPNGVEYRYWLSVYRYKATGASSNPYSEVSLNDEQTSEMRDIVDQLNQICLLCPTYGPAYSTAGQIEQFILDDKAGLARIKKGFRLARNDPVVCFVAGCSDASEGDIGSAQQKFARAIKLDGRLFKQVVMIYIDHLSRPDLAVAAAGDDIRYLYDVLNVMDESQYTDYAEQVCRKMTTLLEEKSKNGTAEDWEHRLLGICYKRQGRNEAAIECYRRALGLRYGEVDWRFELADLLAKCDKASEAMDEARICLQLSPGFTAAKNLLADCSVHPSVLNEAIERRN
jgi:tetratricopeptide (TPR) repeat protein